MREMPAWILRLNIWDVTGVVSYSLLFALGETLVFFLGLLFLGAVLPARIFRDKFVALATSVMAISTALAVFLHTNDQILEAQSKITLSGLVLLYMMLVVFSYFLINRSSKLEKSINSFVRRLAVLSFMYVVLDIFGVVIVIIRNA